MNPSYQKQKQSEEVDQTAELVSANEAQALEAVERATIDIQIATARKFPRPALSRIKERMLSMATMDEETAELCYYSLPRGDGVIEGPSVRLAEITAACYGNLRVASRPLETVTNGTEPHVTIMAQVLDLENNLAVGLTKRRRITKKKYKGAPDEDDINLATNACTAIAFRDAVFKVVPLALVTPVLEQCKKIAKGNATSLGAKRTKVLQRLGAMGVTQDRILKSLGLAKPDDIQLEHIEVLIGRGTALKEGGMVEELFPIPQAAPQPQQAPAPPIPGPGSVKPEPKPDPGLVADLKASIEHEKAKLQALTGSPAQMAEAAKQQHPQQPPDALTGPQAELADLLLSNGFTWEQFAKWATLEQHIPDAQSLPGFGFVSEGVAKRLLRAKVGLLRGMAEMIKEAGA